MRVQLRAQFYKDLIQQKSQDVSQKLGEENTIIDCLLNKMKNMSQKLNHSIYWTKIIKETYMNPAKNERTLKNAHNSSVRNSFAYFESWYLQLSKVDVHSRFAISMYLWKAGQWNERVTVENNK